MDFTKDQEFNYTTPDTPAINKSPKDKSPERKLTQAEIDAEEELYRQFEIREQDRLLPMANVARVMKKTLPEKAKLSKDAKMCVQECVSEFISFITSGAVDKVQAEKRKTLNGEDLLYAMNSLGFENYAEVMKIYLAKYREHENLDADARREKEKVKRQLRKEMKDRLEAARNNEDYENDENDENDENELNEGDENELNEGDENNVDYDYPNDEIADYVLNADQQNLEDAFADENIEF